MGIMQGVLMMYINLDMFRYYYRLYFKFGLSNISFPSPVIMSLHVVQTSFCTGVIISIIKQPELGTNCNEVYHFFFFLFDLI